MTGSRTIKPKASHAALLVLAQILRATARLLFVIVTARVLGPEGFGIYALLLALVEMLAVASGSGYADYLTREAAVDERVGWGLGAQLTLLRLLCIAPIGAVGLVMLYVLGYPRLVLVGGSWFLLSLVPRSVSENVQGVLRGIGRYTSFVIIELGLDLALLTGALLLLMHGGGLSLVIAIEVIAAFTGAIASLALFILFRTRERIWVNRRELLRKSAVFNVYTFVGNLYDRVDVLILSRLAGNYATGVYGAAYRPIATLQLLPYGVLYSLLPALVKGDRTEVGQLRLEKAIGLLLSAAFLVVLATMAFSDGAIRLTLGERFAECASALKLLIWAVILRYLNYGLNIGLLAARRERVFVTTSLACLAVNLLGNLVFVPIYSWRAAAILTIVTELVLFLQNAYWFRRIFGVFPKPFKWLQSSLAFAALVAVAVTGVRVGSPVVIGSACLLLFVAYLYRSGMLGDFTSVWHAEETQAI